MNNEWKPHRKQEEFLAVPLTVKEALMGGGAGSAKTETLLMYGIAHRWHENPRFKQVLMRRTMPELRNEVVPRAKVLYRPFNANYNSSDHTFTFPSGAAIFLSHCEHEDDVHKYDSMEISLFTPDELTTFTEYQYLYIGFQRVRAPKGSGLPSIIRASATSGGPGHGWVKKRFVDPYPKGSHIIKGRGGNKRIYIHATLLDNPHIDPSYKQSLEGLPEAEKQAKLYGSWDAYLGQVFEEFRDHKYPDEPSNAIHVVEPFDIPAWWPRIVAIDWGFSALTWVGWGAISPEGRLYVYREQAWRKTKIEEWAPYVREYIDIENPREVRICKSAGQQRGQEHTILQQIQDALKFPVQLTGNSAGSRVDGKMLLHEYLRWNKKYQPTTELAPYNEELALSILRNKGLDKYKDYVNQYSLVDIDANIPKLQIFNTCEYLINAIKSCSYDKHNPEDVAEFPDDDPYDGCRYLVDMADRYINESIGEFNKVKARDVLTEEFMRTGDYNSLYHRARILDGGLSSNSVGVRRYARH